MLTRYDYMQRYSNAETDEEMFNVHHEYYSEIARVAGVAVPADLLELCRNSGDKYFNDTTRLMHWDSLAPRFKSQIIRACKGRDEGWSFSTNICVLKAAARNQLANNTITPKRPEEAA